MALKLWVTVKLPENLLFTPAMGYADDVFECCIMFQFCPLSNVLLKLRAPGAGIKRSKLELVVDCHKIPVFCVVVFKIK